MKSEIGKFNLIQAKQSIQLLKMIIKTMLITKLVYKSFVISRLKLRKTKIIDKKTYHTDKPKTIIVINWLTRNNSDTN